MIDLRNRPIRIAVIATLTALSLAAAAFAATSVNYSGRTSQRRPISFTVTGNTIKGLEYHIDDRCARGKFLFVSAWGFPALEIKSSKFGGTFVGFSSQKPIAIVNGTVSGNTISGTISDRRKYGKTHKLCFGKATFTLTHRRHTRGSGK